MQTQITMDWDDEVDVVCTGSGVAGLAMAVAVSDIGGQAFVAGPTGAPSPRLAFDVDIDDAETTEYLAAMSADLGQLDVADADIPIRLMRELVQVDAGAVAPFVGSRLRTWGAQCLTSPYGYLYSRVSGWRATELHTNDGDLLAIHELGLMTPDPDNIGGSVFDWLKEQASDRRVEVQSVSRLERIVFEEGIVAGAVFTTPEGPLAIRARHGVTVVANGLHVADGTNHRLPADESKMRVCLVSQTASRFGRLELMTAEEPDLTTLGPSACRASSRQIHANLHESQTHSPTWRCGKGDGYPPRGK